MPCQVRSSQNEPEYSQDIVVLSYCAIYSYHCYCWASLVIQLVKNLPAKWETWVRSLGWEDPLEKGKATHSNILA